jgi:hypothetical protein
VNPAGDRADMTLVRIGKYFCYTNDPMNRIWRAVIEMAFIIFLFYSNLLMGEFTRTNGHEKTLLFALGDIFTVTNVIIAMIAACIGYVVFEFLRKQL